MNSSLLFYHARCIRVCTALAVAPRDFAAGPVELGFDFVSQFKLVFEKLVEPSAQLLLVRPGKPGDGSFDFLHRTHAAEASTATREGKQKGEGEQKGERGGRSPW
jgi:hypothetical protein